jgi:two-component system, NarL family, invasion response regulator UvrY
MKGHMQITATDSAPDHKQAEILIVDDHGVVRRGLVNILREAFPKALLAEAVNGQEALEMIWAKQWDVVLLDVSMPGRSGLEVLKDIKKTRPKLPVLVLSMHPEDQFAMRVLQNGAAGYLSKQSPDIELIAAVTKALSGGKYVRASIAEKLVLRLDPDMHKPLHDHLSDREYEVLRMIGSGKTVKEIGAELSLSIKTISTYRTRILEKMNMKNNAELMRYAMENGLVPFTAVNAEPAVHQEKEIVGTKLMSQRRRR